MKLPPYGKPMAERLKFTNLPFFVVICIGMNSWERAKRWNAGPNDTPAMVLPPDKPATAYQWPVSHCHCIIDWDVGPSDKQVLELVRQLLQAGAALVNTRPLFTDYTKPTYAYSVPVGKWIQVQEVPRGYHGGYRNADR